MSVSDVFITDAEASDLKPMDNMEGMLHHPYQLKRSLPGSNRMDVRIVSFNNPGFGQRNEVQIPSMDLIAHEMYVEFNLGAETTVTGSLWQPTPTWLTQQGADLNYKEVSIYNMSESECLMSAILDEEDVNWTKKQNSYGFNQAADAAETAQKLYLPLNVLATQVLSRVGPLSAYSSNDWSVSVDLRAENLCMAGSTTAQVPDATLTGMRLIILGSKAPVGEVAISREALMKNGIVWNFLRSNHIRSTLADNNDSAINYQNVYSSVVGSVCRSRLLIRNKSKFDAVTSSDKNNIDYQFYNGTQDSISVGKTSNPFEVWGQNLSQPFARNFFSAKSLPGAGRYLSTASTVAAVETGIFDIAFAESKGDLEFGLSTGSYPVKNDLQIDLNVTTDTLQDNYLDSIIYTHVRGVITAGVSNVNVSA